MKKSNKPQVAYRDLAKMFAKALPIEDSEFTQAVETYLKAIKRMNESQKHALTMAYIFSRKVPRQEREDMFQDIALAILKAKSTDLRLAYAVARCDWKNWWQAYKIRQHFSLDTLVTDSDSNEVPYSELLVGECEFENRLNGDLDGERLFESLPEWVQGIVKKRLLGHGIRAGERKLLDKWVSSRPMVLANYQS